MLLLLQLLACAPSADPFDALDALPVGEAGPPLPFDVTALLPGQVARAVVQGPPQGATVLLAASAAGPGAGPCDPSGATCLDITSPRLFAMQWSGGRWQFSGPVPPRTGTRWFQAVASYNGVTSKSAVIERVFGDADLDLHAAGDDCDDTDPHIYVGAPEPCDSVDNDCDGTVDEDGCAGDGWRAVGGFAVLNGSGSAFSASECATNFFGTTTPTVGGVPFELAVAPGASMIGVPSGAVVSAPFADHQPTAVYVINPGGRCTDEGFSATFFYSDGSATTAGPLTVPWDCTSTGSASSNGASFTFQGNYGGPCCDAWYLTSFMNPQPASHLEALTVEFNDGCGGSYPGQVWAMSAR